MERKRLHHVRADKEDDGMIAPKLFGPQPFRDYPPPSPIASRVAQAAIDGTVTLAICAAAWLAVTGLAEAIVS